MTRFTETGRFPSNVPTHTLAPRTAEGQKIREAIIKQNEAARQSILDMDFADIELRVAAQFASINAKP